MQERIILQSALQHFTQHTGLPINQQSQEKISTKDKNVDGVVEIIVNGQAHSFLVEIKNELRQTHVPQIIHRFTPKAERWLLVVQYLSKPNRLILKENGINYLDASGNCNIRQGSLVLYINDVPVTPQRQPQQGKLWKPAGLKLVFALLKDPQLANQPYRAIAQESGIALGTVGGMLEEMKAEGFLKTIKDNNKIENREILLNRWIENFQNILRPKLSRGKFKFVNASARERWKDAVLSEAWWGGEPAGALLTDHLNPEKFTLYSDLPKPDVIRQLRLVPDANGELDLLHPFWNTKTAHIYHRACVPPVLAYAELNASLDSRNRATADRIKQQYNV